MEWFAWLIVGFAVLAVCRGGCARAGCGWSRLASGRGGARRVRGRRGAGRARSIPAPRRRPDASAAPKGRTSPAGREETRLAALQRRFVEGRIDVDEYERELDRLYALDAEER